LRNSKSTVHPKSEIPLGDVLGTVDGLIVAPLTQPYVRVDGSGVKSAVQQADDDRQGDADRL